MPELIISTAQGLYCPLGDFFIDPRAAVPRAVITHAHAEHVHPGCGLYRCARPGRALLERQIPGATLEAFDYGTPFTWGEVTVSLHPAGHVLGSAQVRVEHEGEVWITALDYKREPDPTCAPFEVLSCDVLLTGSTFGLPVYQWDPAAELVQDILSWWDGERARGRPAILLCQEVGKAQRVLAELQRLTRRTVYLHPAVAEPTDRYRAAGIELPPTATVSGADGRGLAGELVLAPPSARRTLWMRRFDDAGVALASGWMRVRGERRRQNLGRGFALSDHADFPALVETVRQVGARDVRVTHGYAEPFARYLREQLGVRAAALPTKAPRPAEPTP